MLNNNNNKTTSADAVTESDADSDARRNTLIVDGSYYYNCVEQFSLEVIDFEKFVLELQTRIGLEFGENIYFVDGSKHLHHEKIKKIAHIVICGTKVSKVERGKNVRIGMIMLECAESALDRYMNVETDNVVVITGDATLHSAFVSAKKRTGVNVYAIGLDNSFSLKLEPFGFKTKLKTLSLNDVLAGCVTHETVSGNNSKDYARTVVLESPKERLARRTAHRDRVLGVAIARLIKNYIKVYGENNSMLASSVWKSFFNDYPELKPETKSKQFCFDHSEILKWINGHAKQKGKGLERIEVMSHNTLIVDGGYYQKICKEVNKTNKKLETDIDLFRKFLATLSNVVGIKFDKIYFVQGYLALFHNEIAKIENVEVIQGGMHTRGDKKHSEKGVDVTIATLIFDSAATRNLDNLVVITGDSDLTSAFISASNYSCVYAVGETDSLARDLQQFQFKDKSILLDEVISKCLK